MVRPIGELAAAGHFVADMVITLIPCSAAQVMLQFFNIAEATAVLPESGENILRKVFGICFAAAIMQAKRENPFPTGFKYLPESSFISPGQPMHDIWFLPCHL
jgi:hypothetical protein